jgi:hypothetical protein
MRSPFHGMDPHLEYRWKTVHFTLISAVQAQLQGRLPAGLRARAEQDVFVSSRAKPTGDLKRACRRKLQEYQSAGVNIVEIDLLRSGRDRLLLSNAEIPAQRRAAYYTCVNWAKDPSRRAIYPMPLRNRLPVIPVPCRETDDDVPLDLQAAIDPLLVK